MRLGNGAAGFAEFEVIRRRWLIFTLLAIVLLAASAFAATQEASADNGGSDFTCGEEFEISGFFDNGGEDDCTNFPFENGTWEAVFDCPTCEFADITIKTPTGDDIADIEIEQYPHDAPFTLVVTFDKGEGPPPGKARVDKDGEDMDRCRGNHDTDCVKVKRVGGARTEYTVNVDQDPRFRFR